MILSPVRRVICLLTSLATLAPFVLRAYLVGPPEGLGKMTTNADLICKARVISSIVITNASFRLLSGFKACETKLEIISVLKGKPPAKIILFQHYASAPQGIMMYSPQHYELEAGQCYLIFTVKADHGEFQQIRLSHTGKEDEGVIRTLDDRPLTNTTVKSAHWQELLLLLQDSNPTNQLYAIRQLDAMSRGCSREWGRTDDFPRGDVLKMLAPIIASTNDDVAIAALKCFQTTPECAAQIAPYADTLVEIGSRSPVVLRRVTVMGALSGAKFAVVSNALPQWLADPSEDVRRQAVLLLPDFPGAFSEHALRKLADDPSPKVRAGVADAVGNGKIESLLPTLKQLLVDNGDVHAAAGNALLKFDVSEVGDILKANLNDEGFRPNYLCKLAEGGAGPWLTNLVEVLERRRIQVEQEVATSGIAPEDRVHYLGARMTLSGTYYNCWDIIYKYLEGLPPANFAEGKLNRCLTALENAGTSGSRQPTQLYELYRVKGLPKRAAKFRMEHGNQSMGYDINLYYDRIDAQHPPAEAISER